MDVFLGSVSLFSLEMVEFRIVTCFFFVVVIRFHSVSQGFMQHSPIFYGFYTNHSMTETYKECFNAPLIYCFGIVTILFISLVMIVHRSEHVDLFFYLKFCLTL